MKLQKLPHTNKINSWYSTFRARSNLCCLNIDSLPDEPSLCTVNRTSTSVGEIFLSHGEAVDHETLIQDFHVVNVVKLLRLPYIYKIRLWYRKFRARSYLSVCFKLRCVRSIVSFLWLQNFNVLVLEWLDRPVRPMLNINKKYIF